MIEAENDEHLQRCHRAVDRMNRLVDDLLELARQGESATDLEPVSLREIATICWQTVDSSDLELTVESDLQFEADKGRLKQLLENLYRNVTDHAEGAEIITIGTVDDGFYVADDGTGIPESERDSVFESGYSTSEKGTGFGLSIVDGIVDAHGWHIHVTESERGGARFEITGITRV
jgi:signal transduction histidine kinase